MLNNFNFSFVINPKHNICGNSNKIDLLIYIHSSPSNFKRRISIRKTWAQRTLFKRTRTIFVLGTTNVTSLIYSNQQESDFYGDIVQSDFVDTYKNLTLKAVMAIRWIKKYCPQAKFILKTDDDVIVS